MLCISNVVQTKEMINKTDYHSDDDEDDKNKSFLERETQNLTDNIKTLTNKKDDTTPGVVSENQSNKTREQEKR